MPSPALYLTHLATALPNRSIAQAEAVERMSLIYPQERTQRLLRRLARNTGVERRHQVALDWQDGSAALPPLYLSTAEHPQGPGMGTRNARFAASSAELLHRAAGELDPSRLRRTKTLITASCTHASSPGLEISLFDYVNSAQLHRWNLGFMGCSAGLAAVRLAATLASDSHPTVVAACELSSLHLQYSEDLDQITANLLFADGAAIALLDTTPGPVRIDASTSMHLAASADQMVWFADDCGLRLRLSQDLPDTLEAHVAGAVDSFLASAGAARSDIAHWIVHPGGPQILDAVQRALSLPPEALHHSREVLREYGNMSSVTVFFILQRLLRRAASGRCLAVAFGPGLTIELALLDLRPR